MADNKTGPTDASVDDFLAKVPNERRRQDAKRLRELMAEVSGEQATMWGPSIIGFGVRTYDLAGGKKGEICQIGFSPRAQALVLYLNDFPERGGLLERLGKHKTGAGCIYVNKLDDVDPRVLRSLVAKAYKHG